MLGAVAAVLALSWIPATATRDHVQAGRAALQDGRRLLLVGDLSGADASFARAHTEFVQATASARSPLIRAVGVLPWLGRSPDVVVAIAEAGLDVAIAGQEVTDALAALPGGLEALAPRDGVIPVDRIQELAPAIARAEDRISTAASRVRGTRSGLLLPPIADARWDALGELADLQELSSAAAAITERLPPFLGSEGERRYFFGAQNPAELRGTGGFIGAYSIMTADDGAVTFGPFRSIATLPDLPRSAIESPNEDYARIYRDFGAPTFWRNLNMTPDLPTAAVAIQRVWEASGNPPLDGVMVADPEALRHLLSVTGPVEAPALGVTLTADNVVALTTNELYGRVENSARRKAALGVAASVVLTRFLEGGGNATDSLLALTAVSGGGHLQIYSDDPALQRALVATGVGGALRPPGGDFLSLVQSNGGQNKVDFYLDRSVSYSVDLGADGTSSGTVEARFTNHAPTAGAPKYVLGPVPGVSERGESYSLVGLYCARTCTYTGKTAEIDDVDLGYDSELGVPVTLDLVRLGRGESGAMRYRVANTEGWIGDEFGGTYRLTFRNQTTIRPTHLRVEVHVPEGMSVVSTSPEMRVQGGTAVWDGTPGGALELEVRFRPDVPTRLWRWVVQFLTTPIVRW